MTVDANIAENAEEGSKLLNDENRKSGGDTVDATNASDGKVVWRFVYRPEIDGLRFWAIMPVIAYHYNAVFGVTGGYAGVDVFFVISGYLITSIVLRELCMEKPVLRYFWERRVRRLFPAIATMFVCLYAYGWFMLAPNVYNKLVGESLFGLIAGSNFYYYATTKDLGGYAAAGPEAYPLLHFWSLAVEEQFYMILPVVLVLVWRFCKTDRSRWMWTLGCLGLVLLASFVFSTGYTPINSPFCFYLLFARAWELAIGSLVGIATSDIGVAAMSTAIEKASGVNPCECMSPFFTRVMLEMTSWIGFALILLVYFFYTKEMEFTYPYYYALGPCLGAAMVIIGNTPTMKPSKDVCDGGEEQRIMNTCGRFLSLPLFVWVGKISYALYLWHWPLWCFQGGSNLSGNSTVSAVMLAIVAIALASVSTSLIEQPFRSVRRVARKPLWIISGIVWTALMSFSIAVYVLEVGGSNKSITSQAESGLTRMSAPLFTGGFEPKAFFIEDANSTRFTVEGLSSSPHAKSVEKEILHFKVCDMNEILCKGAEDMIVYNEAGDPPCLAFLGNSHMRQHIQTIYSLAKEYDVSFIWLIKPGNFEKNALFSSPLSAWDKQRIKILKQWEPRRVIYQVRLGGYPYHHEFGHRGVPSNEKEEQEAVNLFKPTSDALMSGNPEKVLWVGDNPKFGDLCKWISDSQNTLSTDHLSDGHSLGENIQEAIQEGRISSLDFLSTVEQRRRETFHHIERTLNKLETFYNGTFQFRSTYPAFMDANNEFVQVVGAETEGGNVNLYHDCGHLSVAGSMRLKEYFRYHVFKDLVC